MQNRKKSDEEESVKHIKLRYIDRATLDNFDDILALKLMQIENAQVVANLLSP